MAPQDISMSGLEPVPSANFRAGARKFDDSRLELAGDEIDEDVERQIRSGLIHATDLSADADTSEILEDQPRQTFRRKVTKLVEVPVIRKVKVPTMTQEMVPVTKTEIIKVVRKVPQQKKKWAEEAFTEIQDQQATRMKEVWVKKMVPETYVKKVEVRKLRKIEVDYTDYVDVHDEKKIEIETTELRDVPGWRVDEVKDTKMVEIEGWQEVELVPRLKDTNIRIEKTFRRECPKRRVERRMGTDIVDDADARLDDVDTDSEEDNAEVTSVGRVDLAGSHRTRPPKHIRPRRAHNYLASTLELSREIGEEEEEGGVVMAQEPIQKAVQQQMPPLPGKAPTPIPREAEAEGAEAPARPTSTVSSGDHCPSPTKNLSGRMFGLRMIAGRNGLTVLEVAHGGYAEEAGLAAGDVIAAIDGDDVRSVPQWRRALSNKKPGHFLTLVVRSPDGKSRPAAVELIDFNPTHYA